MNLLFLLFFEVNSYFISLKSYSTSIKIIDISLFFQWEEAIKYYLPISGMQLLPAVVQAVRSYVAKDRAVDHFFVTTAKQHGTRIKHAIRLVLNAQLTCDHLLSVAILKAVSLLLDNSIFHHWTWSISYTKRVQRSIRILHLHPPAASN